MKTSLATIALLAGVLGLAACDRTPSDPPTPVVKTPRATESGVAVTSVADPSLPSADSVFRPTNSANAASEPVRTDGTRNPAQESTATPMPGQNNDHSAPLGAGKTTSTP